MERKNTFDPVKGIITYSAGVTTGGAPVSGNFILAVVKLWAKRSTQSLNVGFSRLAQPPTTAGFKGINVLRDLIGFPVELALEMSLRTFTKPFDADVAVVVRPNGNQIRVVDARLNFTPANQPHTKGIKVNKIKPGDGTLNDILPPRFDPEGTIDVAQLTTGEPPRREFVMAVVDITSSSQPSSADRIDFSTLFPRETLVVLNRVPVPVRFRGVNLDIKPPGPVTNLRKQVGSLDLDTTPTFLWGPPVARPKAGIKRFDVRFVGADGTSTPPPQTVTLKYYDAEGTLVASSQADCLAAGNLEKVTSFEFTSVILPDGRYILEVNAVDNLDQPGDASLLGFIVDTTPPSVPVASGTFAVEGAFTNDLAPVLAWLTSVDPGDLTRTADLAYDVEVSTSDQFQDILRPATVKALSWQVKPALTLPNRYYWWRVRAVDDAARLTAVPLGIRPLAVPGRGNDSAFSTAKSFLVDQIKPTKPGIIEQEKKGDLAENITGKFTWACSADPGFVPGRPRLDNTGAGVDFYQVVIVGAGKTLRFKVTDSLANCPLWSLRAGSYPGPGAPRRRADARKVHHHRVRRRQGDEPGG